LLHLLTSGIGQVFGRRQRLSDHALRRPAAEKRQGTKSQRWVVRQRCGEPYGDLAAWSFDTISLFPNAQVGIVGAQFSGTITTHTRFNDNIVRFGLNYKFGNYYAP
jgi:hypothetical protein